VNRAFTAALIFCAMAGTGSVSAQAAVPATASVTDTRKDFSARVSATVARLQALAGSERPEAVRQAVLRIYLDDYEAIEGLYGPGSGQANAVIAQIAAGEAAFHAALQAPDASLSASLARLTSAVQALAQHSEGIQVVERRADVAGIVRMKGTETAETREIGDILSLLAQAEGAHRAGNAEAALRGVERAYLEGFEPLESRLPATRVNRIEKLIHLELRPQLARAAEPVAVALLFQELRAELLQADQVLSAGTTFMFGALNSFAIIMREGLEAVLLIAALLAYLAAVDPANQHRRRIYAGVVTGCVATLLTWLVARLVIPIGGGSRELVEGITGLVAVAVLLYVSNWLFQKTYIHDWKDYLRKQVGHAMSSGSTFAMAGLAFAAIYREGFETVLFYQAIAYDSGTTAVLAGFVPGFVLICAVGFAIIRLGVKLPLRKMFAVTNGILLYLAFVLLGKGFYNLQEAGLFAPHHITWMPDTAALRQIFGLYPLAETVLAQVAFVCLVTATFIFYKRRLAVERLAGQPAR
jgi:FTR1 family protein